MLSILKDPLFELLLPELTGVNPQLIPKPVVVSGDTPSSMVQHSSGVALVANRFRKEMHVIKVFRTIQKQLDNRPHILRLGRLFSETVLVEVDGEEIYLSFDKGRISSVTPGPSRKTPWRFAFRTDKDALAKFWQPVPEAGFHDIFGLVKTGRGQIDGDILCLVKNLRFFKDVLALARAEREGAK